MQHLLGANVLLVVLVGCSDPATLTPYIYRAPTGSNTGIVQNDTPSFTVPDGWKHLPLPDLPLMSS